MTARGQLDRDFPHIVANLHHGDARDGPVVEAPQELDLRRFRPVQPESVVPALCLDTGMILFGFADAVPARQQSIWVRHRRPHADAV